MQTRQAVFLFRDEERKELVVRSAVGIQGSIREGHDLVVPPRLKNILWALRNQHAIHWVEAGIKEIGFPIIVAPVWVKRTRVGLLVTGAALDSSNNPYGPVRQNLFALIAVFASLVIENTKVYDLLKQQFALSTAGARLTQEAGDGNAAAERFTIENISNPAKVARILAESFYQELKKAGFSQGHIATAAAQILDCITKEP
ncbi:MAG: hypothetical protein IJJ26_13280 [Victivallales bacterium]|nr:hypothetical protein [Victivallales bacterium]